MYPISFDNPNQLKAANRNVAGSDVGSWVTQTEKQESGESPEISVDTPQTDSPEQKLNNPDPHSSSLLVVECRSDDKWRVALCTDLAELDIAMDTARELRGSPDVDEVCLTLEVSGDHGRESRREVLRFDTGASISPDIPEIPETFTSVQSDPPADQDALAVLDAALKIPDYCVDELDFLQFSMAPKDHGEAIRVEIPVVAPNYEPEPDPEPVYRGETPFPSRSGRLEADDHLPAGIADAAPEYMDIPVAVHSGGPATKLLVFAGSIALLVLGGALAELLAVDITSTANAGVGSFDTFSNISGDLFR